MHTVEGHIKFEKNGRYFLSDEPKSGQNLLIALHGYGYLAQYFIRKFDALSDNTIVLCPEGLHRFYKKGTNGRVGASWMTKEDRLNDIEDYVNFLDTLLSDLKNKYDFNTITLLGFSQGGATASRWLAYGNHKFDRFILWATVFPPDMEKKYNAKFKHSENFFVFGTKDEYYTNDAVKEHYQELNNKDIPFEMLTFDGGHEIHTTTLQKILHE